MRDVFKDAFVKRRAQASTVMIFKCEDPKRLNPFLSLLIDYMNINYKPGKGLPPTVYLYKVWSGLFEVRAQGEVVQLTPVKSHSPIIAAINIAPMDEQIRNLDQALRFIDEQMNKRENVAFVMWGLFKRETPGERDALIAFLKNAIFTDDYYVKNHVIAVFSESPESLLDETTLKHSIFVDIPPSTDEERREILASIARELNMDVDVEPLVMATKGLSLHETESVALESLSRYGKLDPQVMASFKHDIVRKSGVLDIEEPSHGFEAVGGYHAIKRFIEKNVIKVLRNPAKARALGLTPPRGILLFGPPGTGKTILARALARELSLPFLRFRTERIVSMWYGQTSQNMAKALRIAESIAPCILFIDEVDRFGKRGGLTEHEETRRAFSILLEWLGDERRKTIVVATTNKPEDLDEAFIRVGRFDYIIPMLYPDYEARLEILKVHTSVVNSVPLKGVDLREVAAMTELWSGAELRELVMRAARCALEADRDYVSQGDFHEAYKTFRIDMNARRAQMERYLKLAEEYTNDASFLEEMKEGVEGGTRLEKALSQLRGLGP